MAERRWPDGTSYVEAVQTPTNLSDADLRSGKLECRSSGLPKPYSGGFTTTFHFDTPSGAYAVRCFTRGDDDLERRYSAIDEFLCFVQNRAFCHAQYCDRGILVEGRWWPIVKMFWVDGRQLNAEVEACLNEPVALRQLAEAFRKMTRSLAVLGVAHGDLQHGNIIVAGGELRLIDYDGMFLPELAGMRASEFGHRNYQHPQRPAATFDARLDRFSSIVIYTALIALSEDPSLWKRFNNDENLLFQSTDFDSPSSSELLSRLSLNTSASELAAGLAIACSGPIEQVPTLEQVIAAASLPGARAVRTAGAPPLSAPFSPRQTISPPFKPGFAGEVTAQTRATTPQVASNTSASPRHRMKIAAPVALMLAVALLAIGYLLLMHGTTMRDSASSEKKTVTPTLYFAGDWQLDERNVQYGQMIWNLRIRQTGTRLELDATKIRIAGAAATECERETHLRAELSTGSIPQTVQFQETNCYGTITPGLIVVTDVSDDRKLLSGHFEIHGNRVGDFVARKVKTGA